MPMMYSDDKTWKQHYSEWKRILPKIIGDDKGTEYRRKVVERLISEYEVMNK